MGVAVLAGSLAMVAHARSGGSPKDEIEAFNKRYIEIHLNMDTQAIYCYVGGRWRELDARRRSR